MDAALELAIFVTMEVLEQAFSCQGSLTGSSPNMKVEVEGLIIWIMMTFGSLWLDNFVN